jgi:hypothetical protein
MMSFASQKGRHFSADFSQGNRCKNQLDPVQKFTGEASVLSHCSLLSNPLPKASGALEHCREVETNCWFPIFRGVTLTRAPKASEDVAVRKFPSYSKSSELHQLIPGTF